MIYCNKLNYDFNRENIDRDFDIFRVSKEKGNYFKSNILDISSQDFLAKSVVYNWGNEWYVMFDKGTVNYTSFKAALELEDPESIINKVDITQSKSIYDNVLAQLLFNTLGSPTTKEMKFNNISGKLYYFREEFMKKNTFFAILVSLSKDNYLKLNIETFSLLSKIKGKNKDAKYLFDENSGRLRKKLTADNVPDDEIYVKRSMNPNKKNAIDFLDFSSYKKFQNCKVGIYAEFMDDVKYYLSDYIKIGFGTYSVYNSVDISDDSFEEKEYGKTLKEKGVCIIDEEKDADSIALTNLIKDKMMAVYGIECIVNRYLDDAYAISIIHNKEYYEKNNISDKYKNSKRYSIAQHVTIEDFKLKSDDNEDAALKKIIQELLIKGDIFDEKLSLVNWNERNAIKFVCGKTYWKYTGEKNKKFYKFYRMSVSKDGLLKFDFWDSQEFTEDDEWIEIYDTYEKYNSEFKNRNIEGLVYYDKSNINVIMKTEQTTLPKIDTLARALRLSDKDGFVNVEIIIEALKEFAEQSESKEMPAELSNLYLVLNEINIEEITIGEILEIINIRKKVVKEFNSYLYQTRGILLHPTPKVKEIKEEYFGSLMDIKYFYNYDKLYYFVGTKSTSLNLSLHNACLIREVVSIGGEIFFEQLMKLLAVEFVRNGQYTVLPFPFKYLNEYIRQKNQSET
ncbi:MAG: hypothetical protein IKY90_08420 [Oscillospiraceae bacterium]|nr:hypothetical protein [Oscillospiraceae bacterium]